MPESTSSNTIVGTASWPSAATSIASEMRDSSPPDATLRSGRGGWPALAETRNSARSAPCGSGRTASTGQRAMSKRPPPMPNTANSGGVAFDRDLPALGGTLRRVGGERKRGGTGKSGGGGDDAKEGRGN